MKPVDCDCLEVFPGAVPGWLCFGGQVESIRALFDSALFPEAEKYRYEELAELSYIGLVAYFEGFVKYHFASVINICPRLLTEFAKKRPDVSIPLLELASLEDVHKHIGFVIAELFSFGSPKEINGLFRDLLSKTPFSEKERRRYDQILQDRHQIVHSASLYTSKYLRTTSNKIPENGSAAYVYGIVIEPERLLDDAKFLLSISKKITTSSYEFLKTTELWASKEEMEMMSKHVNWLQWNEMAFCKNSTVSGDNDLF